MPAMAMANAPTSTTSGMQTMTSRTEVRSTTLAFHPQVQAAQRRYE